LDHFQKDIETSMNLRVVVWFLILVRLCGDSENGRVTAPDVKRFEHLMSKGLNDFRLLHP